MKFKTDGGGFATSCDDIKVLYGASTWATRLSQLAKTQNKLIIMTYGFKARNAKYPNEDIRNENSYVRNILNKHPKNVFVLCNTDSVEDAKILKQIYPDIMIKHKGDINANIVLLEPHTVFFASDNFGYSAYDEFGIGIHSKEIYDNLIKIFRVKWKTSNEL
ncbi:MAG: hypothetical protein NC184_03705 [Roseburia sp.]|nr:hypothetical protein [Roseburia sp.]